VQCNLDDEIGVHRCGDPVQERDGRKDAAGFESGERGLGHAGSGRNLDLGRAECEAAFADGSAEQVGVFDLGPPPARVAATPGMPSMTCGNWHYRVSALHINGGGLPSRHDAVQDCPSAIAFALEGNPADYDPTSETLTLDVTLAPAA
jgi:hypothetical protein